MLVAILYVVHQSRLQTGSLSFDYGVLLATSFSAPQQWILFLAFALAFAIKVPMFPFHTWLPDAHVEAPTAGCVILAGVLLKMGTYGFIRFAMPLFPEAALRAVPLDCRLAIIGIIYGALVAMVQKDVKKLVAYSSVSHLGFVMLGLFALNTQAVEGAILRMLNHGISTGGAVPAGRHHLRAPPHAADRRIRRHYQGDAGLRHHLHDRDPVVHRAAAAQRFRATSS